MASLISVIVFNIASRITNRKKISFIISTFLAFGTLIFPYSGVTHHDVYGTFFLILAFYFLFQRYQINKEILDRNIVISGILTGLAFFISFNTIPAIVALILFVVLKGFKKDIVLFITSCFIGLIPSFLFNYISFGHPFNFSMNLHCRYYNLPQPELSLTKVLLQLGLKINSYLISPITAITFYSPISLIGFFGLFLLNDKYYAEKTALVLAFILYFLQPTVDTAAGVGWCQYGSRYLLESTPFLLIGLSGFFVARKNKLGELIARYSYTTPLIMLVGVISIIICSAGSIIGVMYCDYSKNAFISHLAKIISGNLPYFPFIYFGIILIIISILFLSLKYSEIRNLNFEHINKWIYITLIIVIAFILRFYKLDKIPLGLYSDEASIGYNAYCISETGKDEHGELLPIYFKAFGEYKNPVLIYISAIFIKLFGPSIFTLRFTSCVLGLITVFFTYKLAKLYFDRKIALLSSFLLAVSPWLIQYSRIAMDPIAFPPFFVLGFYLFSVGLKSKPRYIVLSVIPISISLYSYAIAKVFIPVFYFFFLLFNRKLIINKKLSIITWIILIMLMLIPMYKATTEKNIFGRFNAISIFNSPELHEKAKEKLTGIKFFHTLSNNKLVQEVLIFFENYKRHMSIDFLLKSGDWNRRHNIGNRGQLLLFTFIMGIVGFIYLIFKRIFIFPAWFLLFPIASSLTSEGIPHASRCICGMPVFEILASVGFFSIYSYIKNNFQKGKNWLSIVFSIALFMFSAKGIDDLKNYLKDYFIRYAQDSRYVFDYNTYAIANATENLKEFDKIIIPSELSYVTLLYLHKINPKDWLTNKSVLRFVKDSEFSNIDPSKKVIKINSPGSSTNGKTISLIFDEVTKNVIYEVKLVENNPALNL
jgi:4-amino-4-deoxy-L-arabinose transferase-like glycosyltransferase